MNENPKPVRPVEQEAIRTTIVGGRPPGCGKGIGNVPRGVEVLVKKAAVDAAFRAQLLDRRSKAAELIGLALTPAEAMMLDGVPRAQLEAIIERTTVHPSQLPAFLGMAAGVMLVALGAVGCEPAPTAGISPDRMPDATRPAEKQDVAPVKPVPDNAPVPPPTRGVQPDRPPAPNVKPAPDNTPVPPSAGVRPEPPPLTKGIQPDRPQGK